ncbi:hypothetical protein QBC47DRAFT_380034 [Echria macrotheca]|uniref:Uncharacterized protein n=1 Tax=Echria macrotheca TaxID=438768 RepID=A0AAJ0FCT9_9PEZI|nr:hypothetical protein QBC47DRAFT_380034 [Echria macrotheca]
MAVTTAVTDLFASFYELFASIVNAAWTIVHSFIMGIAGLFTGVFTFFADIFKGLFDVVGGVGKFVTGNFVILGVIAAGAFAYFRFTEQGQMQARNLGAKSSAVANKKTN